VKIKELINEVFIDVLLVKNLNEETLRIILRILDLSDTKINDIYDFTRLR